MSTVAIITARGGSKRIPHKNIKDFCGKPIMAYSIDAALDSGIFDEVMVSTDDDEIAHIAKKYGAVVPFMRSEKTSDDFATTADVLCEVLSEYRKRGMRFETMCCIYPTAPFVTAKKLKRAFGLFKDCEADEMVPVVAFSYPPQRSFSIKNGYLIYNNLQYIRARSQDLTPWYHDAGQFYFYKVDAFETSINSDKERGGYEMKTVPYMLDEMEVQDIDNMSDWKLAEMKYRIMTGQ